MSTFRWRRTAMWPARSGMRKWDFHDGWGKALEQLIAVAKTM
jgi:hypothetical protein